MWKATLLFSLLLAYSNGHDHGPHLGHFLQSGSLLAGGLAGSGQMLSQSLAAGLAVNSQWFTPATATGPHLRSLSIELKVFGVLQILLDVLLRQAQ